MSYTKEVTLWCDTATCAEWISFNNHESDGGKVLAARIAARRSRWTFVDGKDYCREHSTFQAKVIPDPVFDGPGISLGKLKSRNKDKRTVSA